MNLITQCLLLLSLFCSLNIFSEGANNINLLIQHQNIHDSVKSKIICHEELKRSELTKDSIIIKTCLLGKFKFVSTGYPDYSGKYNWEYELYKKNKTRYIKAENSQIFTKNQNVLFELIKKKILKEFADASTDPETKDCFIDHESLPNYGFNDLQIAFIGDEIWFELDLRLSGYCRNVNTCFATFKITEVLKFIE